MPFRDSGAGDRSHRGRRAAGLRRDAPQLTAGLLNRGRWVVGGSGVCAMCSGSISACSVEVLREVGSLHGELICGWRGLC